MPGTVCGGVEPNLRSVAVVAVVVFGVGGAAVRAQHRDAAGASRT